MKYLVQIILSSNTTLNILVRDAIEILQKSGFLQIELIKCISHLKTLESKMDTVILQFELKLPDPTLVKIEYLHKLTSNKLRAYKIRMFKMEDCD